MNKKQYKKTKLVLMGLIITLTVVLTGLIFVGLSLDKHDNKSGRLIDLASYYTEATVPSFGLKLVDDLIVDRDARVEIYLDGISSRVDGVTLVLNYDESNVEIGTFNRSDLFTNVTRDVANGVVTINAYPGGVTGLDYIEEGGLMGALIIKPLSQDESEIGVVCGSTADSVIMYEANNMIVCNANQGIMLENIAGNTPTPTPTDEPSPTNTNNPTPTAVPTPNNNGGSGGTNNFAPSKAKTCEKTYPSKPSNVQAKSGPNKDQVTLSWNASSPVTDYGITFGRTWIDNEGPNEYGATNIGNVTSYIVNGLIPGQLYYFVVYANNDCANSGYSDGVNTYAGFVPRTYSGNYGSGTTTPKPTPRVVITPRPIPTIIASPSSTPVTDSLEKEDFIPLETSEPEAEEDEGSGGLFGANTGTLLPVIGGVILILLGILFVVLVKYLKQKDNIEE